MTDQSDNRHQASFSLRTLLLCTTVLALAVTVYLQHRKLAPLEAEVHRLRDEAGYLTIDDPTKVHAIQVETDSPLMWKWKVHVPATAAEIGVKAIAGNIPAAGDEPEITGGMWTRDNEPVEAVVTVQIHKDLNDEWMLKTSIEVNGSSSSASDELSADQLNELRTAKSSSYQSVGRSTEIAEIGEKLILFRQRFLGPIPYKIDEAGPGVLVWIRVAEGE